MKRTLILSILLLFAGSAIAQRPRSRPAPQPKPEAKKEDEKKKDEKEHWLHVKNVEIHPIVGSIMRGGEILCRDGKIVAMGRDLEAPQLDEEKLEYEVLDGKGLRAYPGLVALNGSRLVPPLLGKPGDNTDPMGILTKMTLAHGITTTISGTTAIKLDANGTNEAVLRGGLFTGIQYSSRNPQAKAKLREELAKARDFIRATRSGMNDKDKAALQKKLGSAAKYIPLLEGKQLAVFNVSDRQAISEVCELVEHFGFRACLRGADEGWIVPGQVGRSGVSAILTPRQRNDPDAKLNRQSGGTASNPKVLWDHGVPIAFATAANNIEFDAQPGRDGLAVTWEAGAAVAGGLPEEAAIRGITLAAARIYGLDDRIGSLEIGKDADIIICDGEVLHYETMVQWAIVNGRLAYDKSKENIFRHIRPLEGEDAEKGRNWWPRSIAPMPAEWAYDAEAEARKKIEAEKPAATAPESRPAGAESKPSSQPASKPSSQPASKPTSKPATGK